MLDLLPAMSNFYFRGIIVADDISDYIIMSASIVHHHVVVIPIMFYSSVGLKNSVDNDFCLSLLNIWQVKDHEQMLRSITPFSS